MTLAGGFISSWHRKPVNVVEPSGSFEFTLMHFGCEPSGVLYSPGSGVAPLYVFSSHFSQRTIFLERVSFEIDPARCGGVSRFRGRDCFVFSEQRKRWRWLIPPAYCDLDRLGASVYAQTENTFAMFSLIKNWLHHKLA